MSAAAPPWLAGLELATVELRDTAATIVDPDAIEDPCDPGELHVHVANRIGELAVSADEVQGDGDGLRHVGCISEIRVHGCEVGGRHIEFRAVYATQFTLLDPDPDMEAVAPVVEPVLNLAVWPYARQWFHQLSGAMGLDPVVLPLRKVTPG